MLGVMCVHVRWFVFARAQSNRYSTHRSSARAAARRSAEGAPKPPTHGDDDGGGDDDNTAPAIRPNRLRYREVRHRDARTRDALAQASNTIQKSLYTHTHGPFRNSASMWYTHTHTLTHIAQIYTHTHMSRPMRPGPGRFTHSGPKTRCDAIPEPPLVSLVHNNIQVEIQFDCIFLLCRCCWCCWCWWWYCVSFSCALCVVIFILRACARLCVCCGRIPKILRIDFY